MLFFTNRRFRPMSLLTAVITASMAQSIWAGNFTSISNGAWNVGSTWSLTSGTGSQPYPSTAADNATINNNLTVPNDFSVTGGATVGNITVGSAKGTVIQLGTSYSVVQAYGNIDLNGQNLDLGAATQTGGSANKLLLTGRDGNFNNAQSVHNGTINADAPANGSDDIAIGSNVTFTAIQLNITGSSTIYSYVAGGTHFGGDFTLASTSSINYNGTYDATINLTDGTFYNQGTIAIQSGNGAFTLDGKWDNSGSTTGISVDAGGNLNLGGTFTAANVGIISQTTGANVSVVGVLDLQNSTTPFVFGTNTTGPWTLNGGTIKNGILDATTSANQLIVKQGTFNSVTFNYDPTWDVTNGNVIIHDGITLAGPTKTLTAVGQALQVGNSTSSQTFELPAGNVVLQQTSLDSDHNVQDVTILHVSTASSLALDGGQIFGDGLSPAVSLNVDGKLALTGNGTDVSGGFGNSLNGTLQLDSSATLDITLSSLVDFGSISVTNASIAGLIHITLNNFAPHVGDSFDILQSASAFAGTPLFANEVGDIITQDGYEYQVSFATIPNLSGTYDAILTVVPPSNLVPEPASLGLLLAAGLALAKRRR